jgi:hypothetical protein
MARKYRILQGRDARVPFLSRFQVPDTIQTRRKVALRTTFQQVLALDFIRWLTDHPSMAHLYFQGESGI